MLNSDKIMNFSRQWHEECGVVGTYTEDLDAANVAAFALYALQHRGQESAGVASSNGNSIQVQTGMGLINQSFKDIDLEVMQGNIAIAHTRYSTTGSNRIDNAQPILSSNYGNDIALAHNGNLVNARELKQELIQKGVKFTSSNDSEVIAHFITTAPGATLAERLKYCMQRLQGAYSLALMTPSALIAIRDPRGVRPLCIGRLKDGWVVASESCALDHVGAKLVRDVKPGEAVQLGAGGIDTIYQHVSMEKPALCVFEHIYFARPDSIIENKLVHEARVSMGVELAKEHPVDADMVVGVPDSASPAATGYAQQSGIPYGDALVKNRYVGRTFILPDQRERELGVRRKLNPMSSLVRGKRLVVVDDSIVRGTTTPPVVRLLKDAGATEVHLRICAPPIQWPCHYGVDMATRDELIAADKTPEEVNSIIGSDSLGYLSIPGLLRAVKGDKKGYCMACFTGDYPIPVQIEMNKLAMEI